MEIQQRREGSHLKGRVVTCGTSCWRRGVSPHLGFADVSQVRGGGDAFDVGERTIDGVALWEFNGWRGWSGGGGARKNTRGVYKKKYNKINRTQ